MSKLINRYIHNNTDCSRGKILSFFSQKHSVGNIFKYTYLLNIEINVLIEIESLIIFCWEVRKILMPPI